MPGRPEGRLRFIGEIANGIWRISEASPAIAAGRLHAALLFALEAWVLKIEVQGRAERAIVQAAIAAVQAEAAVEWKGRTVLIGGCKPYTRCRIAASLFRTRFADLWPMAGA